MTNQNLPLRTLSVGIVVLITTACNNNGQQSQQQSKQDITAPKPNIILIQTDDQGWDDLGLHGNKNLETPVLDQLAQESVQFSQYYVNPVSAPTRATLLTGRHFLRTGVSHVHGGKDYINMNETLLPEVLKSAGYATGMWGKWHSGHAEGYYPWQRGFDEAYMAKLYKHENSEGLLNGDSVQHQLWADEVITNYAIDFINRHKDTTFFAYLPYLTCHEPLAAPASYIKKYEDKGLPHNLAILYAMIDHLDGQIERLLTHVQDLGLNNNTVIIFMSDNGPAIINNYLTDEDRQIRYVNKLKGHKGNIWENGVKSPLFIRWLGQFEPATVDRLVDVSDIYPTLADLCGAKLPDDQLPLDGRSFLPYLYGQGDSLSEKLSFNYAGVGWPPSHAVWTAEGIKGEYQPVDKSQLAYYQQIISIRNERYKLLFNPSSYTNKVEQEGHYVLIDIRNDPLEEHNLMSERPEVAQKLQGELQNWFTSVVQGDHSFQMPVFRIGADNQTVSHVYAKAPLRISEGLKNTAFWLAGWQSKGDWAEYQIDVMNAGDYSVVLNHESEEASNAKVQILVGSASVEAQINDSEQVIFGTITLSAGRQILKIEVVDGQIPAFEKLTAIELVKQ